MSKKKQAEESAEVEYEHGLVEYETPARVEPETPKHRKRKPDTVKLEHDAGCWCGAPRRIQKRCDGHPTRVHRYPGGTLNFICPAGNGITSPPKAIVQAAEKAGLLAKEKPNG